ncbi:MAG: DUF362 domain-containing protein [Endomicrobiaceae bacterium]|nr:DUF362 domain-containing protein [Endomicrobiaceae bacterium]
MIKKIANLLTQNYTRKSFFKIFGLAIVTTLLSTTKIKKIFASGTKKINARPGRKITTNYDLVSVKGEDISSMTKRLIDELGGIEKFVKKGDIVVVKPNIGWNRVPEYAATTNPELVATIIEMCLQAGAKKVNVFDNTCNEEKMCYKNSGIENAVKKAGGNIYFMDSFKYIPGNFPEGSIMQDYPMYADAIKCDCFINIPIAKTHGLAKLTLAIKNLMGVCGGNRSTMHWNIDKKLAETLAFVKPDLNIVDGYRILTANGPRGGNLSDVKKMSTLIASTDAVLTDAYATKKLFNMDPKDIAHIKTAYDMGLGNINIDSAKIREVKI